MRKVVVLTILGIVGMLGLASAHPNGWFGCPCPCCQGQWWALNGQSASYNVSLENCKIVPVKTWWGTTYLIIDEDNEVIGRLWQKVDLKDVKVGEPFGWHVPLIYNGTVVGFVWIS
ncbi:hypothetical protein [Archaeoglobus sp.]